MKHQHTTSTIMPHHKGANESSWGDIHLDGIPDSAHHLHTIVFYLWEYHVYYDHPEPIVDPDRNALSKEFAQKVHFLFTLILLPILSILGLTANVISFQVLRQKRMIHITVTNIIILAIVVSDILFLLHGIFFLLLILASLVSTPFGNSLKANTASVVAISTSLLTNKLTTWLTVLLSFRSFFVIHFKRNSIFKCRQTTVLKFIAFIYVTIPVLFIPHVLSFRMVYNHVINNHLQPTIEPSSFGQGTFSDVYLTICTILHLHIPFSMLAVINVPIVIACRRSRPSSFQLTISQSQTGSSASSASEADTNVAPIKVYIALIYLICSFPNLVHSTQALVSSNYSPTGSNQNLYKVMGMFSYFAEFVNASTILPVYLSTSNKFRTTCRQIVCCHKEENALLEMLRIIVVRNSTKSSSVGSREFFRFSRPEEFDTSDAQVTRSNTQEKTVDTPGVSNIDSLPKIDWTTPKRSVRFEDWDNESEKTTSSRIFT